MSKFDEYATRYAHIEMERRGGILQMRLHSGGGPLQWTLNAQSDLADAFGEVAADRENRIVILTGTGTEFTGPRSDPSKMLYAGGNLTPAMLDRSNAKRMLTNLLSIEVPMIAVINGPAMRHAELPLTCDLVLAADDATIEDTAHFQAGGIVPGDGVNIVLTMLLGLNRARYMMYCGQILSAREAKDLGLVAEVLPRGELLPRAWELAEQLAQKPDLLLRYTRIVLIRPLRKLIDEELGYHLAMERLAMLDAHK